MINEDIQIYKPQSQGCFLSHVIGCLSFFNADNLEIMRGFKDNEFDLAIVDPPYGLGDKLISGGTWSVKWQDKGADWDKAPSKEYWEQLFRVSKNWIVFGGNYFIEYLPNCRNFIAWHKPYMDGMHSMSNVELALTSFDRNAKKISFNKDKGTEERIHVCQKPIQLYEWLLKNYANKNDKIIDTHLGSGSIAIAVEKANRLDKMNLQFVGIEIYKEYYKKALNRIEQYCRQGTLSF